MKNERYSQNIILTKLMTPNTRSASKKIQAIEKEKNIFYYIIDKFRLISIP